MMLFVADSLTYSWKQLETAGDSMASDSAQYKIRVCLDTRLLLIADTCTCVAEPNLHAQQGAV